MRPSRSPSAPFCCTPNGKVPLQPTSYAALTSPAQCPSPVNNGINYAIDGCSVPIPNIPATNIQDPAFFLDCAITPILCQQFNQASTAFGANVGSVPQTAPPQTLSCNRHDVCYQTCGNTQASCDATIHADMDAVCTKAYPATCPYSGLAAVFCPSFFLERIACFDASTLYFDGVVQLGGGPYEDDQTGHCQCCR
jgi:hypothetical protein